jgi:hypothetical protein
VAVGRGALRRAVVSAVLVGAALTLINHGAELASGALDGGLAIRIGLTFVVPFVVSLVSSATAIREANTRS